MRKSTGSLSVLFLKAISLVTILLISGCVTSVDISDGEVLSESREHEQLSLPSFEASLFFAFEIQQEVPDTSGKTIKAVGSGLTESEARTDALTGLSRILYAEVVSSLETKDYLLEVDGRVAGTESSIEQHSVVSTNLPILGAQISTIPRLSYDASRRKTVFMIDAALNSSNALPLYERELEKLSGMITEAEAFLEAADDVSILALHLSQLLSLYLQYEKLSYVAHALGSTKIPLLEHSRIEIELQLINLSKMNDSYERAARNLTQSITQSNVYVYPAKLNGMGGITAFAEQLSYAMSTALGRLSVSDPKRADFFMIGNYTLKDDGRSGIYVTYRLEDRQGNILSTSLEQLLPSVYEGQEYLPKAYDFQKQLERGEAVDTQFLVDIRINGMRDYLSFNSGEELTIEVRATAPCFFYVIGYVFTDQDESFSYLFPLLLDGSGKEMFIHRVSAEDVNKWIIINPIYRGTILPIEIIEPYGVEMLQVYASTERNYQSFLETVPGYIETEDYYVVSDNPEDGLKLTRALNVKKVADEAGDDIRKAEASVSFKSGM
jgi:hypothetical protein